jgi:hypothetical protein
VHFWASPRSLVATQGISVDFFSSGYLDISVPRVRPVHLCIQCTVPPRRWVSPFGHCRIKACCQLPDTFRRLPRPSSPLTAKASTVCALSLDHITPSRLGAIYQTTLAYLPQRHIFGFIAEPKTLVTRSLIVKEHETGFSACPSRNLCVRVCCFHVIEEFAHGCAILDFRFPRMDPREIHGGASRDRTGDPLLAKQVLSQLSYGPLSLGLQSSPQYWWVWEDSNLRPHPYQGCALTT